MTAPKICAVPGCGAKLYDRNYSGVCKHHAHEAGYCLCGVCRAEAQPPNRDARQPVLAQVVQPNEVPLVPDPETASMAELCRPLSARVMPRNCYSWAATTSFSSRNDE